MEQVHRRFERALEALTTLSAGIGQKDSAALLASVVEMARALLGGEIAVLALYETGDYPILKIRAVAGVTSLKAGTELSSTASILGSVALSSRPEVVADARHDPRRDEVTELREIERGVFAPLIAHGRTLGAIMVGQSGPPSTRDDDPVDLTILTMIGQQAAAVLVAAESIDAERSFSTRLQRLSGYVARAGASAEPDGMDALLREMASEIRADAAFLSERGEFSEPALASFARVVPGRESGFEGWACDLVVRVPRAGRDTRLHLLSRAEHSPFRPGDIRLAEVIAVQIGALLDRLALLQEVRDAAAAERSVSLRLRELYDDIDEGILVLDGTGKVTFCSRKACHLLHTSPNGLLGNGLIQVLPLEDRMSVLNVFLKAAAGMRARGEFHVASPHGDRTIVFTSRPEDPADPVRGVRMVLRDVTEERHRESDTLHREKLASVGELAAGIAHEINNPVSFLLSNHRWLSSRCEDLLGAIAVYRAFVSGRNSVAGPIAEMEQGIHLDETVAEIPQVLADSLEGIERVRRIVSDMRMFSRRDPEMPGAIDVASLLDATVGMCAPMIRMSAKVTRDIGTLPILRGWSGRLGQAFLNLVMNAAQSIPSGQPEANEVKVSAWSDDAGIHVSIRDTGTGIAPNNRMRLFSPFFTTKAAGEGTGLGLALAYESVRRHNGRISVESEVGVGSTFTVFLPFDGVAEGEPRTNPARGGMRVAV